jgi:hypothetical protein
MDMSFCPLSIEHIGYSFKIFFESTSNILAYAQIYSDISLLDRHEAYRMDKLDGCLDG